MPALCMYMAVDSRGTPRCQLEISLYVGRRFRHRECKHPHQLIVPRRRPAAHHQNGPQGARSVLTIGNRGSTGVSDTQKRRHPSTPHHTETPAPIKPVPVSETNALRFAVCNSRIPANRPGQQPASPILTRRYHHYQQTRLPRHSPMPLHRTPPVSGESDAYSTVHSRVKALRFPFSAVPTKTTRPKQKNIVPNFCLLGFAGCRRLDEGVSSVPSFIPVDLDILHEKRTPIWPKIGVAVSIESGDGVVVTPALRKRSR